MQSTRMIFSFQKSSACLSNLPCATTRCNSTRSNRWRRCLTPAVGAMILGSRLPGSPFPRHPCSREPTLTLWPALYFSKITHEKWMKNSRVRVDKRHRVPAEEWRRIKRKYGLRWVRTREGEVRELRRGNLGILCTAAHLFLSRATSLRFER